MRWTHPRACAQLLDRGVDCGLVYPCAAERLKDLTFPEERRKDAAGVWTWVSARRGKGEGGGGALRIGEHDV